MSFASFDEPPDSFFLCGAFASGWSNYKLEGSTVWSLLTIEKEYAAAALEGKRRGGGEESKLMCSWQVQPAIATATTTTAAHKKEKPS
jgi:hypothetical protein